MTSHPGIMTPATLRNWLPERWLNRFTLAPTDLLRDATYRRLWTSILISSFGGQVTLLALPLTAAVLLHATPTQMGLLTAMEIVPFVLFSLPAGVWLDRVRKLPCVRGRRDCRSVSRWRRCRWPGGSAGCRSAGSTWSA
jgi:MFS family permease